MKIDNPGIKTTIVTNVPHYRAGQSRQGQDSVLEVLN